MKKNIWLILLGFLPLLFCQCGTPERNTPETPDYNEYVSLFTSGTISRKASVKVVFSEDIPQSKLDSIKPEEVLKLSPSVEGAYLFSDARTLVFKPKTEMSRAVTYDVKVNVNKLFPDGKDFKFGFFTRPFDINGGLKSFDVTADDIYELVFALVTSDGESAEDVERHVTCSLEGAALEWNHDSDGLNHQLKVRVNSPVVQTLTLTQEADRKLNAREHVITNISLPSSAKFSVVSQRMRPGDSKCLEITFNKNLDPAQSIQGLIYVKGRDLQSSVDGNKVLLTGEFEEGETVEIIVDKKLRSKSGILVDLASIPSVTVATNKPAVEFVRGGNILPLSDHIVVPFRSVYMRGIRVQVFKVLNDQMGAFLQRNSIGGYNEFSYVARPVLATTFYIDTPENELGEWHNYAIDLSDQFKAEPGSMYRIELSLDPRLSAWPSKELPKATRQEIAEEDAHILDKSNERFDEGGWYYTGQSYNFDQEWDENYYKKRQDPACSLYYHEKSVAKNILATNIGLSAQRGLDQSLSVTALRLIDAEPLKGVEINVYNFQQQLICTSQTSSEGIAQIEYNKQKGQPHYLIARLGNDVSYLKVNNEESLSTSSFDVSGEHFERGLRGYIYGERGVWRPGDTLHLGFMLNDRNKLLPSEHPVTLKVVNPLGQVTNRLVKTQGVMGLYTFSIPTAEDAPTGIWSAQITVGGVTFCKNLRVESIKPNRLKINLTLPEDYLRTGNNSAQLHTEWLNGSVAHGLKYEIKATYVETAPSWTQWSGFVFKDPTKPFETSEEVVAKGTVGETGDANLQIKIDAKQEAPGFLRANFVTHVYEPSGEFSIDGCRANVSPYARYVGIKSPLQPNQMHLDTDKTHAFQLASVDPQGHASGNVRIKVDVYKVVWYWWWEASSNDMAGYTTRNFHQPVQSLEVVTDAQGLGSFNLNMTESNWGTYLIVAKDLESGHSAGLLSYFDWPWMTSRRSSEGRDNATRLSFSTDKEEYVPGEKIHIVLPSESGSRAIVSVCNGSKILSINTYPCQEEQTEIVLDVTEQMMPNAYVAISLVQPYGQAVNDMPIRLYGIVPFSVNASTSHLNPMIGSAEEFLPESQVQVTVSEQSGRPMGYTLAIVDEGLLDLTRFKTPNAWGQFNAREALGVRLWDLYGFVSGAFGGRIEQMFSVGGDEALNNGPKAIVNRFRPMVFFDGPFQLRKGEKRTHTIRVPNYNGRVRIMAVAGDGSAYGSAEKSVLVRRPLMIMGTMPRQLGRGDEMTVSATVFATEPLGEVKVNLTTSKGVQIVGETTKSVSLKEAGDQTVQFRVRDIDQIGEATISLVATAKGHKADYTVKIPVRVVSQTLSQTFTERIEAGATWQKEFTMLGAQDFNVLFEASTNQPLNMASRLNKLIMYPHGCVEQTTSKAFPQLFLGDFALLYDNRQKQIENNVKNCISRLANYQTVDGGMSYWPGISGSHPWASAYVLHFLTEASSRGYYVPEEMMNRLTSYVRTQTNVFASSTEKSFECAYMLYVLASRQSAEWGAMNRMKEHASEHSLATNQLLAAAYAVAGRTDVAKSLFNVGSAAVKDHCWFIPHQVVELLALTHLQDVKVAEVAEQVRQRLVSDQWLSTSHTAFMLISMSQYYKRNAASNGLTFQAQLSDQPLVDVKSDKYVWNGQWPCMSANQKLRVVNRDSSPLFMSYTLQGVATQSEVEALSNGLELSLSYTTDQNVPVSVATLSQSSSFRSVLKVRNTTANSLENIAVTHILPAGWEVLSVLPEKGISYQDVRDDRVLSYIDHLAAGETVTIPLSLSATYVGRYYVPSVRAEAMYNATISGCTSSSVCEVK